MASRLLFPAWLNQVRYTLVGGPESPWSAMLWWMAILVCTLFAFLEAVVEAKHCLCEMYCRVRDTWDASRPPTLGRSGLSSWFWPPESVPWVAILAEAIARVLFVLFCGMFSGACSLLMAPMVVPALIWCAITWFAARRLTFDLRSKPARSSDSEDDEQTVK